MAHYITSPSFTGKISIVSHPEMHACPIDSPSRQPPNLYQQWNCRQSSHIMAIGNGQLAPLANAMNSFRTCPFKPRINRKIRSLCTTADFQAAPNQRLLSKRVSQSGRRKVQDHSSAKKLFLKGVDVNILHRYICSCCHACCDSRRLPHDHVLRFQPQ